MLIALAILLGLGLAFFFLPVLIALKVEHPGPSGALRVRLNWGFLLGGIGLQVRLQGSAWHLHPLLMGRGLPFPRLRLDGPPDEPAPAPATATPPTPVPHREAVPPPAGRETPPAPEVPPAAGQTPPTGPVPPTPKANRGELGRLAREWIRPGLRLLGRLAGTIRLRRLWLGGRFGLADPAATGQVFGYLQAVRGVLPRRLRLDLSPDFLGQGVRGTAQLAVHFYLGKALYLVVSFAARVAWRWWGLRRAARRSLAAARTPSPRR